MAVTVLVSVFVLQHGRTVHTRYSLVEALKHYVKETATPTGVTFQTVQSIPDGASPLADLLSRVHPSDRPTHAQPPAGAPSLSVSRRFARFGIGLRL